MKLNIRVCANVILTLASLLVGFPCPSPAQTFGGVVTWHNDNGRSGQNLNEIVLTPRNVNSDGFGKILSYPVDGQIYAQPLYVPNLQIRSSQHNVVFVATENNSVYAFDADGVVSAPLWHVNFSNASTGLGPVNCITALLSCNVYPTDGITGTPVIDPTNDTIYLVSHSVQDTTYHVQLHALDITSGAEKFGGPVEISATVNGTGTGNKGGKITMAKNTNLVRPGLLLLKGVGTNGTLYIAAGGYPHAWVFAYDPITLAQLGVFNSTPNGTLGGIWQSGGGIAADSNNNIYVTTGDGTFDASTGGIDYGDTLIQLSPFLSVNAYFTPMDQSCRFVSDMDLSSGGPMVLPPQPGPVQNEVLVAGKGGYPCDPTNLTPIYLTNASNLGGYNPTQDDIVQEISGSAHGYWSNPAYFQGASGTWVFFGGSVKEPNNGDYLKAYSVTNGLLSTSPTSQSPNTLNVGATPSVSANGNTNGIVWVVSRQDSLDTRPGTRPAELFAYDATNLASQLYSSAKSTKYGLRDQPGCGNKFQVPTVANGKVFVGTESELDIYGLLGTPLPAYPVIVSQPCLNFGTIQIGKTGMAQTVTLTNNGTSNLTINGFARTGTNGSEFTQTNNCKRTLAPGASCTITMNFVPTGTGPRFGSLLIQDSAITPQTIYFIGYGSSAISLSPTNLNFGTVTVGNTSSPMTATFKNSSTVSVTVSVGLGGIDAKDFAQSNNCPNSVAPGGSCTMNVTFTPVTIGNRNAQLTVTNSLQPPLKTTLVGTGD